MIKLTKKKFNDRIVFLQKLYYAGYITVAERNDLIASKVEDGFLLCNYGTTAEGRYIIVGVRYNKMNKEIHQLIVENDFVVSEDNYGELRCNIIEWRK